jgi:predicted outer membrane protein
MRAGHAACDGVRAARWGSGEEVPMVGFTWYRASLLVAVAALPALAAFDHRPGPGRAPANVLADDDKDAMSDAHVLGALKAINQGVIDHCTAAQGRFVDAKISAFNDQLLQHHREALRKVDAAATTAGVTPAESECSKDYAEEVKAEIDDLADEKGDELDDEYLADQEELHEKAIEQLDDKLVKAASNGSVVQAVKELRSTMATHLETIRQLDEDQDD